MDHEGNLEKERSIRAETLLFLEEASILEGQAEGRPLSQSLAELSHQL